MLGDERGGDLWIAWASGDGHGALVAGLVVGAGPIVGGSFGIEGRASFASAGGFIRTVPDAALDAPAEGARSAASFAEIGAGELLFPLYRLDGDRKIASTTASFLRITRSFIPHSLPHEFW